ncbi:MAG TPA: 5-formyltetrahydrofolate cyclo-ligase [Candidatus Saccharimonadales bacterium]|nr:5-formyltetrahydrofolate cyclo-ligase [Candidatus Saccharimonadales bacterium]
MDKEKLRSEIRAKRLAMPASDAEEKSSLITQKLLTEIDWPRTASLHTFIPIPKLNEVNTWPLLKFVWQNYPRIVTAVPTARRRGKYESIKVNTATRWRGLLPSSRLSAPPDFKFDVIIVPTLAFDSRGYRLGWGGGFYDRFLASQPRALKIGLCYESGKVRMIPDESHDIPLDKIITEECIMTKS